MTRHRCPGEGCPVCETRIDVYGGVAPERTPATSTMPTPEQVDAHIAVLEDHLRRVRRGSS